MLIDTHCHLNLKDAFPDPDRTLEEAREAGVSAFVVVGIDRESCVSALALADRHADVYAVVGWHPNNAAQYEPAFLGELEEMLSHPKAVAVGEIGFDFHWDFATAEEQERCLRDQLDLADSLGRPVVFHCRKAYSDLLTLLESRPPRPYLFHCFSGDADHAARAVALDAHFGIDGPITYKKSSDLRAILATLPHNRIVLETDSPYLAPEPHRGKPNHPRYLPLINSAVAYVLERSMEEVSAATGGNARKFFGF